MIYLDNSATTSVSEAAARKMYEAAAVIYGNPSSLHECGLAASKLLQEARLRVMTALGAKDGTLVFTGSGTEANNLAVFGSVYAKARNAGGRIITDDSQHPSVSEPLARLASQGYEIVTLKTKGGTIDKEELLSYVNDRTVLVSIMMVNNETGAVYDIADLFSAVKKKNDSIVTHTDAVQGFMKLAFNPRTLNADLISVSGHKIHAPKGIGALYISKETIKSKRIVPYILGGGQEGGLRSGTENVPGAAAFGEAVLTPFDFENAAECRQQIISALEGSDMRVNIPAKAAPHIISITAPSIKSETMLHFLSSRGIAISSGSACSSHHGAKNRVLSAFGLSDRDADCTIRVSLNGKESKEDINALLSALGDAVKTLVRMKR